MPQAHALRNTALDALPRCPTHLSEVARKEWRRLATPLFDMGILTLADRSALAAYCQSYARWVEAEDHLARTPALLKSPSGYVQQSPWLTVANKQLELIESCIAKGAVAIILDNSASMGVSDSGQMRFETARGAAMQLRTDPYRVPATSVARKT